MDLNSIVAIAAVLAAWAAVIVAMIAIGPAREAAEASKEQTRIQRQIRRDAAQPYVWVDIQADHQQGSLLQLVLGNAGPTVARNVRVRIEPAIPDVRDSENDCAGAQRQLKEGIRSLAPGRTVRWSLGSTFYHVADETVYTMTVYADGPFGPVEPSEFEYRPADWQEVLDAPDGSLHHIRGEIKALVAAVQKLSGERK